MMKTKFTVLIARRVAQIGNLFTPKGFGAGRRFAICQPRILPALSHRQALPNAIRRYSRLQICATVIALASLITLFSGCGRGMAQQKPPVPAVTVAPAERKEIVEWDEFTG